MKTLLVTGGAGFIGSNFVHLALARGYRVINVDALTYAGNLENLTAIEGHEQYRFVRRPTSATVEAMEKVFEELRPEQVVHFAAESHVDRSVLDATEFVQTNVIGHAGAAGRGATCRGRPIRPRVDRRGLRVARVRRGCSPRTRRCSRTRRTARARPAATSSLRAAFHTHGYPTLITRCSNNYGPYQFPEKLIPLMIANALEDKELPVYGDGKNVRDWIHVEDHCDAILAVLERGRDGEVYNIGGESERQNLQVVHRILELAGKDESLIRYVTDRPGHDRRYAIDGSKIASELGWRPTRSFEEGLEATFAWYQEQRSGGSAYAPAPTGTTTSASTATADPSPTEGSERNTRYHRMLTDPGRPLRSTGFPARPDPTLYDRVRQLPFASMSPSRTAASTTVPPRRSPRRDGPGRWLCALVLGLLSVTSACTSVEDSRIRQYLAEKGFGTKADGEATAENYVAGGDEIQFILSNPSLVQEPGLEQLFLLQRSQTVDIDGTIYLPYIGRLYVLGMRETTLSATVTDLLDQVFTLDVRVDARIISTGKNFYAFGEIEGPNVYPLLKADLTVVEAIASLAITNLANLGRVKVVKPDARNPLVITVNMRDIIESGYSAYNVRIEENDIIYVPPTFLGHIASASWRSSSQPIGSLVSAALGVSTTAFALDVADDRGHPVHRWAGPASATLRSGILKPEGRHQVTR